MLRLLCTSKISRESLFKIKSNSANRSETTNKQKKKDFEKLKLENNKLMQDNVKLHDKHGYQVQRNKRYFTVLLENRVPELLRSNSKLL